MTDHKTNVPFREGKPIAAAPAMAEENKRLRAENERLTKRVEWFTHAVHTCHDECDRPLCKTTRERDALRALNAELVSEVKRIMVANKFTFGKDFIFEMQAAITRAEGR